MELFTGFFLPSPANSVKFERPSTEKLKLKHLYQVFKMPLFFGILKICGFVFVRKNKLKPYTRTYIIKKTCSYNRDRRKLAK